MATKKNNISIVSTNITLNLKGKKVNLNLEELRTLYSIINSTLFGYGNSIVVPSTWATNGISANTIATSCSDISLSISDLNNKEEVV